MKALNPLKYVVSAAEEIVGYKSLINSADSYEHAKNAAYQGIGFINSMTVFLNTMICMENNDFTESLNEVIDEWKRDIIQALINKADETHQNPAVLWKLYTVRDNC